MSAESAGLHRARLRGLLSEAEISDVCLAIWGVWSLFWGKSELASRWIRVPEQLNRRDLHFGEKIHPWELETLFNQFLFAQKSKRRRKCRKLNLRSYPVFAECVSRLRKLENAEYGAYKDKIGIWNEMNRLLNRQVPWQEGFVTIDRLVTSASLYATPEHERAYKERNGISIRDFYLAAFVVYVESLDSPIVDVGAILSSLGFSKQETGSFLSLCSTRIEDAIQTVLADKYGIFKGPVAYQVGYLKRYPLISIDAAMSGVCFCPIPDLVFQRSTEGVANDLEKSANIGPAFEKYSYEMFRTLLPNLSIKPEVIYGPKGHSFRTPDIRIEHDGVTRIIVECKSTRITLSARFSEHPLKEAKESFLAVAHGIVQIWRYHSHVRLGIASENLCEKVVGVVLTPHNWVMMSREMHDELYNEAKRMANEKDGAITEDDMKSVVLCSIGEMLYVLRRAGERLFLEFVDEIRNEKFKYYMFRSAFLNFRDRWCAVKADNVPLPAALSWFDEMETKANLKDLR